MQVNVMIATREAGRSFAGEEVRAALRQSQLWARRYECASLLEHHQGCVNSLSWSADGRTLLSGSDDRNVGVWTFSHSWEGRLTASLPTRHRGNIFDAQQCPNDSSTIVTTSADGCVGVCHVGGAESRLLHEPSAHYVSAKFDFVPGGAPVCIVPFSDGRARLFDLRAQSTVIVIKPGSGRGVNVLKFRPGAESEFAAGFDVEVVRLYDLRMPSAATADDLSPAELRASFTSARFQAGGPDRTARDGRPVSGLCWSRDGRRLLVNYRDADLVLFAPPSAPHSSTALDPSEPLLLRPIQEFGGRTNSETCCKEAAFLLDESCVATGGDCGSLFIWSTRSGRLVRQLVADRAVVNCVSPHPLLPLLAVSGIDDSVKIFDIGADAEQEALDESARERLAMHLRREQRTWDHRMRRDHNVAPAAARAALRNASEARTEGNERIAAGEIERALSRYARAEELLRFVPPNRALAAERRQLLLAVHSNSALCRLKLRDWDQVIRLCGLVLATQPDSVKALFRRASALLEGKHEYDDAERDVVAGLLLEPTNAELLRLRRAIVAARASERRKESVRFRALFSSGDDDDDGSPVS
jgi:WD repeat-containing protein 42A